MITQEFLSQCSDEQINKGVAWIEIVRLSKILPAYSVNRGDIGSGASIGLINTNYCTNPNDIMPIAFANEVFVIPCLDGGCMASDGVYDTEIEHIIGECNWATNANPLRAICEVYILMSVNK